MRCTSNFCIVQEGVRGREFTPPEDAKGLSKVWCPHCITIGKQVTFFSSQTAQMVRETYNSYIDTNLPQNVKLILEQFSREVIQQLGEEL